MNIGKIDKWTPRSHRSGGFRAIVKRLTVRKARRLGKALLDDAPVRVTKGWAD